MSQPESHLEKDSDSHIKAYRIVKSKWAESAFDGEGAKRYGGRWNSKGIACVYLADSIALAMLEILVHIERKSLLKDYLLFELKLPINQIQQLDQSVLPSNWDSDPAPEETAVIGDQWLRASDKLGLMLPSTIVPMENNYLINHQHKDFTKIVQNSKPIPFEFDGWLNG